MISYVMVCGSRNVKNTDTVINALSMNVGWNDIVVHGGATGVDSIAQEWCDINNISSRVVRPINSQKISYLFRNCEMIGMCDKFIVIWDGESKGTKFVLDYLKHRNKEYVLVMLNEVEQD